MDTDDRIIRQHMQSFGYLLSSSHALFRQWMERAIAGSGIHLGQVVVLATLRAERLSGGGDMTQTRLAQLSGIEKSSLVLFLDALEKDGWVERRSHPADRRAHLVHLTGDGLARFEVIGGKLFANEQKALAIFDEAERAQFMTLLTRLRVHLKDPGS